MFNPADQTEGQKPPQTHTLCGSKRVLRSSGRRMMIEYNGPTSIPDYWISLTGSSRPPRRINTPRHHGRALLKSPHRFGARCGNFSRRRPDPGFVFRTFSHHRAETSSHAREKSLDPRPKAQQSRLNKSNLR